MFILSTEDFWLSGTWPLPYNLYLHDSASSVSGTLPSTPQTSVSVFASAVTANTNRSASTTVGSLQTQTNIAWNSKQTQRTALMGRFVSPPLVAQTIPATNWTFAAGGMQDAVSGIVTYDSLAILVETWRPSTGALVTKIIDDPSVLGGADITITGGTERAITYTVSGLSSTILAGDVLVIEVYTVAMGGTSTISGGATSHFYFDGTTVNSDTDNAACIVVPPSLTFQVMSNPSLRLLLLTGVGV